MIWAESIPTGPETLVILAVMGCVLAVMFGAVVAIGLWRDRLRRPKP